MAVSKASDGTIDSYISAFPPDVQAILQKVRQTIHAAVPQATETISYKIPTFNIADSYLIYFADWKKHISVYPVPDGTAAFEKAIAPYKEARGTLRFPLDKPIPYELIAKVAKVRLKAMRLKGGTASSRSIAAANP